MLRIVGTSFLVSSMVLLGCSDDSGTATAGETGGALIFGNGGSSGSSGVPVGGTGAGASSNGATGGSGNRTNTGGRPGGGSPGGGSPAGGADNTGGSISPSTGGTGTSGTGGSSGAPTGLPIGSLCANDANCSPNVCCKTPACAGPCECQPASNCPASTQFLPCNSAADCAVYGGGKICCKASSGGQTMQYCTKTNGCPGTTLP